MTKTRSHANCDHPATKAGRAKCRKARALVAQGFIAELDALIHSYYDNSASAEEIGAEITSLAYATQAPSLMIAKEGFYNNTLEVEEMINLAREARGEI